MKGTHEKISDSLLFRVSVPVMVILVLVGIGLYSFVLSAMEDFQQQNIKDRMRWHSSQIYGIADRNYGALLRAYESGDPLRSRISQAYTLGEIEDFLRKEGLGGIVMDSDGRVILEHETFIDTGQITRLGQSQGKVVRIQAGDEDYYARLVRFEPWGWEIIAVSRSSDFAALISNVRGAYAATAAILLMATVLIFVYLRGLIRHPLREIITPILEGRPPSYRGISEFQFISNSVGLMMRTIEEKNEWIHRLLETTTALIVVLDGQGRVLTLNRAAQDITGLSEEEARGTPFADLLSPFVPKYSPSHSDDTVSYENPITTAEGLRRDVLWCSSAIRGEDGEVRHVILTGTDITERKRLEEEVFRAQKLESVGVLAGGIAHDFNNLLMGIFGNISAAKLFTRPGSKAHIRLTETEKVLKRAKDLSQQLLTFAKGGAPVRKVASLKGLIAETVDFALRGSPVTCRYEFQDGLRNVEVDAGQIGQVFNNLALNAVHAMPGGGRITVSAGNFVVYKGDALALMPGDYVRVAFSDEGTGIAEDLRQRIFDPYFTTKEKGSGLGLAAAYSIIKKHDGHMAVMSGPGEGATFYLYLPASDKEVQEMEQEGECVPRSCGKVLLMDDEEIVRDVAQEMLGAIGYDVTSTGDGRQAISTYGEAMRQGKPFDAVIMDLTVPGGMGGMEAVAELRRMDPGVKAVVSSGYCTDPVMSDFRRHGFVGVISKPYDLAEVGRVLQDVIGHVRG